MKISSKSFFAAATVFLQGSVLLLNILLQDLQHEAWAIFLVAAVISVFLLCLYGKEDIFSLSAERLGRKGGKILSIIYIVYFLLTAAYNINLFSSFVEGYVLEETPRAAFIILFTVLCAYGAMKGYDNLLRLATIFFAIAVIANISSVFLLRGKLNLCNFLPIPSLNADDYLKGFIVAITLLLWDASIFLGFARNRKNTVWGFALGTLFLLVTILCGIASLGGTVSIFTWPTHEMLRIINSGNTLARVETSSVFILLAMMFFKVCLTLCVVAEGTRKVFGTNKKTFPVIVSSIIIFILSLTIFRSGAEAMDIVRKYGAFVILPFGAAIPLLLKAVKRKK